MENTNEVTLRSSDGKIYKVDQAVASLSSVLKMALDGGELLSRINRKDEGERSIIVQNVSGNILRLVIDYCTYHVRVAPHAQAEIVRSWDADFIKALFDHEKYSLIQLSKASEYLEIYGLLDLTSESIANLITGKSPENLRKMLNI